PRPNVAAPAPYAGAQVRARSRGGEIRPQVRIENVLLEEVVIQPVNVGLMGSRAAAASTARAGPACVCPTNMFANAIDIHNHFAVIGISLLFMPPDTDQWMAPSISSRLLRRRRLTGSRSPLRRATSAWPPTSGRTSAIAA